MPFNRSTVGRMAKVSSRVHFGLTLSLMFGVFFLATGYWVAYKVFLGELVKANYHFLNFVGRAYDQEVFLLRAISASETPEYAPKKDMAEPMIARQEASGSVIYTVHSKLSAMPFSLIIARPYDEPSRVDQALTLGLGLANVYSDFWRQSSTHSPQMFVFDPDQRIDIVLPAIAATPDNESVAPHDALTALREVQETFVKPSKANDLFVHWVATKSEREPAAEELVAYLSVPFIDSGKDLSQPPRHLIAATLVNLFDPADAGGRIDRRLFDKLTFDSIDLMAPDGSLLLGAAGSDILEFKDGFHLTSSGLVIKRSSGALLSWQALYRVSFAQLIDNARWQLSGLIGLLAAFVLGGWWLNSWYRRRIVLPARSDYSELRHNHDFNHSLLQTVPLALCVLKGNERVTCNGLFIEWLGKAPDIPELLQHWPLFDVGEPQMGEGCLIIAERALHVRYAPTHFQDERVLLCTFTDITAHREASAALVFAREAANAANEEKSRFVANVSHEIRTPLYGVLGTLELLGMTELTPRQRTYMDTIDSSSDLLLNIISDVLDMSRIESGQLLLESVEFDPLLTLEGLVRSFSDMAVKKGIALYCCIDPTLPARLKGDAVHLRQIMSNLLNNAIKFTDSGYIGVYLRGAAGADGRWQLTWQVEDTGPGISQAQQDRLFEPFFQLNHQCHALKGAGLGLSICLKLCQLMGASLSLQSTPGQGSVFSLSVSVDWIEGQECRPRYEHLVGKLVEVRSPFPELTDSLCAWLEHFGARTSIQDDPQDETLDAVLEAMPQGGLQPEWSGATVFARHDFGLVPQCIGKDILVNQHNVMAILEAVSMAITGEIPEDDLHVHQPTNRDLGLRVLLAEDNPVNQTLMREQLEAIGCAVIVSSNGREALEQLECQAFDVLLTDVNMPVMDGYALAETVRRNDLQLPIIGVTANALREEGEHCIRVGMNNWLSKPISIEGLYLCLKAFAGQPPTHQRQTILEVDQLHIPDQMRTLFAQVIRQDLTDLQRATLNYDPDAIAHLLHRIRSALAVTRANSLIASSKSLEAAVRDTEQTLMITTIASFIERIEAALKEQGLEFRD